MKTVHINCDLGEGGEFDAQLMPLISACNIACGGHAGNNSSMERTISLAVQNNVQIGAHPSYPDKNNFGRISLKINEAELLDSIVQQISKLQESAFQQGQKLHHIKPHGALYNDAAKDENIARIFIKAVDKIDPKLPIFTLPNSEIFKQIKDQKRIVFEAFLDRNYEADLSLVSRQKSNAVLMKKDGIFKHFLRLVLDGKVQLINGDEFKLLADTFCLHSDTENSVEILQYLHAEMKKINLKIYKNE